MIIIAMMLIMMMMAIFVIMKILNEANCFLFSLSKHKQSFLSKVCFHADCSLFTKTALLQDIPACTLPHPICIVFVELQFITLTVYFWVMHFHLQIFK